MQRLMLQAGQYDKQLLSRLPQIVERVIDEITHFAAAQSTRERCIAYLCSWREKNSSRTVQDFLGERSRTGLEALVSGVVESLSRPDGAARLLERLGDEQTLPRAAGRWWKRWSERNGERTVAEIVPLADHDRTQLATAVALRAQRALLASVEPILSRLNVRQIVVDRINSLDIEQVEALLLDIIHRHLRWINLFGAILGALIGALQVVLHVVGIT